MLKYKLLHVLGSFGFTIKVVKMFLYFLIPFPNPAQNTKVHFSLIDIATFKSFL